MPTPLPQADGRKRPSLAAFPIRTASDYRARLSDAFGLSAPAVEARYPASGHPTPALAWAAVLADRSFACTTLAAGRTMAAHAAGLALNGYEFNDPHAPVLAGLPSGPAFPFGAARGFEMPYLFSSLPTERPPTETQRALSDRVVDYWTRFADTGDPNAPDAPLWPVLHASAPPSTSVQSPAHGPGGIRPADPHAEHNCSSWDRQPRRPSPVTGARACAPGQWVMRPGNLGAVGDAPREPRGAPTPHTWRTGAVFSQRSVRWPASCPAGSSWSTPSRRRP
ncbi:carboxylesterase family protein [Streptomyces sp. NPDC005017]|uniref:carboxylesterase family protein n=1 Tax=Streptomyces sp. NPDC005017 TaxID=3364706 RepID=UPI0036B5E699